MSNPNAGFLLSELLTSEIVFGLKQFELENWKRCQLKSRIVENFRMCLCHCLSFWK